MTVLPNASTSLSEQSIYSTWIACETTTYILFFAATYAGTTSIVYYVTRYKCFEPQNKQQNTHWLAITLNVSMTLSLVLVALRLFFELDTIWGRYDLFACTVLKKVRLILGMLAMMNVTVTYWIRQRVFYRNPVLLSSGICSRFVSIALLPVFIFGFLFVICYYSAVDMGYRALPPYGCSDTANFLPFTVLAIGALLMQAVLAAMFVHPLIKHRNEWKHLLQGQDDRDNAMSPIKRAAITAGFSVFVNVSCLPLALNRYDTDDLPMLYADINLSVVVLCAIFSFTDWKPRLFTCVIQLSSTSA